MKALPRTDFLFPSFPSRRPLDRPSSSGFPSFIVWAKTSQVRHTFIFCGQLPWISPRQIVPLTNQQRWPRLNSHAGHASRFFVEQPRISQQGRDFLGPSPRLDIKKSTCRSMCTGTLRHPCSKLCTALREVPRSWAICFWVFWSFWRSEPNSLDSNDSPLRKQVNGY